MTDNHQTMEVDAQTEAANGVENQPMEDPSSSRFTWRIKNFSRLNVKRLYSDIFIVGGCKWRVLIFPKGNNVDFLSMKLDVADSASLPYGWRRYTQFSLAVVNQINTKYTIRKEVSFYRPLVSLRVARTWSMSVAQSTRVGKQDIVDRRSCWWWRGDGGEKNWRQGLFGSEEENWLLGHASQVYVVYSVLFVQFGGRVSSSDPYRL